MSKISQQDETDFMHSLLRGLDNTFSSVPPWTPSKSKKPKKVERVLDMKVPSFKAPNKADGKDTLPDIAPTSATAPQEEIDMNALLEGAEDWDWSDMLTPKKAASSPKKPKLTPGLGSPRKPLPQVPQKDYQGQLCTRCVLESVSEIQVGRSPQKVRYLVLISMGGCNDTPCSAPCS